MPLQEGGVSAGMFFGVGVPIPPDMPSTPSGVDAVLDGVGRFYLTNFLAILGNIGVTHAPTLG